MGGVELEVKAAPKPPTQAEVKDLEKRSKDLRKVIKASKADRGGSRGRGNPRGGRGNTFRGRGFSRGGGGGRACWWGSECKRPDCYFSHPASAQPNPPSLQQQQQGHQTIKKAGPEGSKIINIHM